jgi:hypothetical protein
MVEIAEHIHLFPAAHRPQIITDDIANALPQLTQAFDLVLIDVYRGKDVAQAAFEDRVWSALQSRLAPRGYLLANAFAQPELFSVLQRRFSRHRMWKFQYNWLALFRPFGQGQVGDPLPAGYQQFRATDAYILRETKARPMISMVGRAGCLGTRWHHGPLWFEGYTGDVEPVLEKGGPRRMVIWQPITRLDKPAGWHRSWIQMNARKTGFAEIKNTEAYWETWTPHAQRHRRRWLKQDHLEIVEVSSEEFIEAYRRTPKLPFLKGAFIGLVRSKIRAHGDRVRCFAARERESRQIVAGFAALDIPESHQSLHVISFIQPQAEQFSVGTGLMDHWFKYAVQNNIRFLDFDLFWAPGEPRSWKGFSKFKSQFVTHFIRYPNPLIRFPS